MFIPVLLLVLSVLLPGCSSLHLTASPVFEATVQRLPNPGDTVALFPSKRRNGAQNLARTEQEAIMWLRDHGISGIEKAEVDRMLREQGISAAQVNDAAVLQVDRVSERPYRESGSDYYRTDCPGWSGS